MMPGAIRPNKKCMQIAYALLKTPKSKRQHNDKKPSDKQLQAWFRDSSTSQ